MSRNFSMTGWAKGSNIYEVNIRQYTPEGNFAAFSEHLPRLLDMGVEILWLMPITPISQKTRQGTLGSYYACSSYTEINPEFGTLSDFKNLVSYAQKLGIKVIIDWVANHTGWDHHWTTAHPDWYRKDASGNFTEINGWHDVIDLDFSNEQMRKAMTDAMLFWVTECGIDGFRCDMAHLVPLDFWVNARKSCDAVKPLFWLAECDVPSYQEAFDVSYAWNWMHVTEKYAKGKASLHDVRNVLHDYTHYPTGTEKLYFTSNHDENSWNGTEYEKYDGAAKAWAVFTCTWQGIPLIYSGQENANPRRLLFFDKDQLEWKMPPRLHSFYATLLQLRKNNPAITEGETFILPNDNHDHLMAFLRKKEDSVALVLLNFSNRDRFTVRVDHAWLKGRFENAFSGLQFSFEGTETFELQPAEYIVYTKVK